MPKNLINQNISSRSDDKKIIDNNINKKNIQKENTNLEKNPFFLGRNLSTNYIIEKQFNDDVTPKNNNELINDSANNSKIDGDLICRDACRSVNESDIAIKNKLKKENNKKKDKSDLDLIKQKKIKIKDRLFKYNKLKSTDLGKDILKRKFHMKKTSFFRGKSNNSVEEIKKEKKEKKNKKVFYSNKMVSKNYNENYFKSIMKHGIYKKIEEEKENENKHIGATERKKNKKNDIRTPLKNNCSSCHFLKIKSPKGGNDRIKFKNH
jgi:hypothetical protein